ncbi:polyphosphate--glucose phosphotransferase [Cryptosporangium arvum]|uniref:Transcriptional regulator/sugar kinase n=1 Tax=Cryptosporangium arvum DSM 44712 TaxID=927661 RepID=A0A011ABE3_9ACTN|nr:ROK family protein [Cryptosporangium arvum]EXG79321.1 transcriptional regulator/sugar kinase [Cryptosporangium arvum DSM 44712]
MTILGIDIGGSGIKGAPVDLDTGALTAERYRLETPKGGAPDDMMPVIAEVAKQFPGDGPIGVTFPGVVVRGVVKTAANLNKDWIGVDAGTVFTELTHRPVTVLNDADAAGVAEMAFGAGRDRKGTVLLFTFGTGIGSALFRDGDLVPNTELGHVELHGKDAELRASDRIREEYDMSWSKWAGRVNEYLSHLEMLFSPDLIIVGGGVSKKAEKWLPEVKVNAEIVPATLQNNAGIVGAAMAAATVK